MTPDLATMLARLGYDARWLTAGFLDEAELRAQHDRINTPGEDQNTEHYRYGTLCRVLARPALSDDEARLLVALGEVDPDVAAGRAMVGDVLLRISDRDALFDEVAVACERCGQGRFAAQQRRVRDIARGAIDDALVDACLAARDDSSLRRIVDDPRTPRPLIERLAREAPGRATRNVATQKLQRRRDPR